MDRLAFELEWEGGLNGKINPEFEATFAHLSIRIDDCLVTNCVVGSGHKSRILVPLYPMAEWFALNWWQLMNEPLCPGREITEEAFLERHGLLYARDGFAIPDLRIFPEGDNIRLKWLPHRMANQSLEFFSQGESVLPRLDVADAITDLIEQVLERLASRGLTNTLLAEEWSSVHSLSSDEIEFCESASRLGLDPFNISDVDAELIQSQLNQLPQLIRRELTSAVTIGSVADASTWVQEGLSIESEIPTSSINWSDAKRRISAHSIGQPWQSGYQLANQFLGYLGTNHSAAQPLPDFESRLTVGRTPFRTLDGLMKNSKDSGPVVLTGKRRRDSQRFQFARSICEFLSNSEGTAALMTTSMTTSQKRSRAFAAELLAPKTALQARLSSDMISDEEVEELAMEFEVSSEVIRKQIDNHDLATII